MMALKSRMVEFKTEGGAGKGYLASPEKAHGGVLVLHAWWGLNDFFKGFANRLASQGFLALAPDLHDGAVATSVEGAKELRSRIADERIKQIVLGATDYLRADPSISGHKIGVVGFSMGAAWSLLLSTLKPETETDRKSTRLNSSHVAISYAVFCLKKKKKKNCIIISKK